MNKIRYDVLHLFTNAVPEQTDVAGKCRTTYQLKQEGWNTVSVVKTKDISTCLDRHGFDTSMGSILYEVPSVSIRLSPQSTFFPFR